LATPAVTDIDFIIYGLLRCARNDGEAALLAITLEARVAQPPSFLE